MTSFTNKNTGKNLLRQTKLLNGSGTENLKTLSHKELERVRKNLPIKRENPHKH